MPFMFILNNIMLSKEINFGEFFFKTKANILKYCELQIVIKNILWYIRIQFKNKYIIYTPHLCIELKLHDFKEFLVKFILQMDTPILEHWRVNGLKIILVYRASVIQNIWIADYRTQILNIGLICFPLH